MELEKNDEIEINLIELFYVFIKHLWIIILSGVVLAGIVGAYNKFMVTPQYTSTTKLYIVNKPTSLTSLSLSDLQIGTQLTKDYMVLVKSRPVTEQVIQNLELDMTHEELLDIMQITNPVDTRILEISILYPDAFMAKAIADEVAAVSSKQISVIMDIKEPNIVEQGHVATQKTSPHVMKNTVLGGIVGIFLAACVCAIIYIKDDTIQCSEDVEKYLGINTIGMIPYTDTLSEGNGSKNKKKQRKNKKN